MIDFDTDKLFIAYYQPGAGGKTVLNCLGLSENFCLQDIHAPLDSFGKFNFLKERIDEYKLGTKWSDLGLGCDELYGLDFKHHTSISIFYHSSMYDPKLIELFMSGVYMPIVCHEYAELEKVQTLFPNSRVLAFTNQYQLVTARKVEPLYQDIRGDEWPANLPVRFSEFPANIQREISDDFPFLKRFYDNDITEETDYIWNVEWFSDVDKTLTEIESLYNVLGLNDFNRERIEYYYNQWKTKVYDVGCQ